MGTEKRCTECGAKFQAGHTWNGYRPAPHRQVLAETCSDACARARKTRLQKRRREQVRKNDNG